MRMLLFHVFIRCLYINEEAKSKKNPDKNLVVFEGEKENEDEIFLKARETLHY